MFSPPKISSTVWGIKYICLQLFTVFYLIQPSSKQIICFDFGKQNSMLPIVFYVPWFIVCLDLDWGSEMVIFESILTTFTASVVLEAAGAVTKIGSSLKSKPLWVNLACINRWNTLWSNSFMVFDAQRGFQFSLQCVEIQYHRWFDLLSVNFTAQGTISSTC